MTAPAIALLTRRLAETPPDFLPGDAGLLDIRAVVSDVLRDLGDVAPDPARMLWLRRGDLPYEKAKGHEGGKAARLALIAAWLLADPGIVAMKSSVPELAERAVSWLEEDMAALAEVAGPTGFVHDEDRREELARLCLNGLGLLPEGETAMQMQDRLSAVSSVARARVMAAAKEKLRLAKQAAEREAERARKVREELQRKAAEEAAAKGSRE